MGMCGFAGAITSPFLLHGLQLYFCHMSAPVVEPRSYPLTIGDNGVLVVPAELQAAHGWGPGTVVIALEAPGGLLLVSVEEALEHVRDSSTVSVQAFLAGRRAEREAEDRELEEWGSSPSTPQI